MLPTVTLYTVLGIANDASPAEVKKAYKQRALVTHPDKLDPAASEAVREAAQAQFRQVRIAFETLSDPLKRKSYDYTLRPSATPPTLHTRSSMYFDEYQAKLAREREEWAKKAEQKHKNRMKSPAQGDTPPTSPGEDVHRPEFERAGSSSSTTLETRASHGPTAHTPIQDGSKPQYTRASSSDVSTRFQTANADTPSSPPPARPAAGQLSPPSPDKQTPGRPLPRLPQAGSSTSSAAAFVCPPPTPLTRTSYPFHPSPSPTANYMSYSPISPPMAGRSASVQWETLLNVSGEDGADVDPAALAEQMLSELRARNPEWEARRKEVLQRQRTQPNLKAGRS